MFEPITGVLSVVSGIFGSITSAVVNYKMKKLEFEMQKEKFRHEEALLEKEAELMIKEAEANIKVVQSAYEGQERLIEAQAFKESIKQIDSYLFKSSYIKQLMNVKGKLSYIAKPIACLILTLFALVDVLKAFIRPGVTLFELGVVVWLTYKCYYIMESMKVTIFTAEYAQNLFSEIVAVLLQLFLVIISWWFCSRSISKDFTKRLIEKGVIK